MAHLKRRGTSGRARSASRRPGPVGVRRPKNPKLRSKASAFRSRRPGDAPLKPRGRRVSDAAKRVVQTRKQKQRRLRGTAQGAALRKVRRERKELTSKKKGRR